MNDPQRLSVLDCAPDAIIVAELDGRIVYVNQAVESLFQCTSAALLGLPVEALMPPEVRDTHRDLRRRYTHGVMVPRPMGERRRLSARRVDGTVFPAEISLSPVEWEGRPCVAAAIRDVTERREAEARLIRSEEWLTRTLDTMTEGLVTVDIDGFILFANPTAEHVLRTPRTGLIGTRLVDPRWRWRHPRGALLAPAEHPVSLSMSLGRPVHDQELALQRADGRELVVRLNAAPLMESDGIPIGGVLSIEDITEQRRAREENTLYHAIALAIRAAESTRDALHIAITRISETFAWDCANAWRPDGDGVLRSTDVVHTATAMPEFERWCRTTTLTAEHGAAGRAFAAGEAVWVSDMLQHRDHCAPMAERTGLRTSLALPVMAGTRVLVVLTFYARDVRPRDERLEHLLASVGAQLGDTLDRRRATEALAASEGRFRTIVSGAPVGIALLDDTGAIQSANPALLRFLQRSRADDLRGRHWIDLVAEADRAPMQTVLDATWGGEGDRTTITVQFRRTDGDPVWGRCNFAAVQARDARVRHAIAMVEDITSQVRADERVRRSEELLAEARQLEAIGRLAGGIAHDFNNLLAVIGTASAILLEESSLRADHRLDVEAIRDAADRGAVLTRQLLAYSRRQVLHPRMVDLVEVVRALTPMLSRMITPIATLEVSLPETPGLVLADPSQLEQVLVNLVINARDALPDGGTVRVRCRDVHVDPGSDDPPMHPGPYVCLEVADDGIGMEAAVRARIFEPFFTTKTLGKGTGLGLATVHGIVAQSGGVIDVRSVPGEGSTFRVFLPAAPPRSPAPPASSLP